MQVADSAVNLTGQTTSIPVTQAFANPVCSGMYAVWVDVMVTSPGTAGTVVVTVEWSNGQAAVGASTVSSAPVSLASIGETGLLLGCFWAVANEPISYSTTVTGSTGNPVYVLRLRFEFLG
jgi:hypothetical protein